MKKMKCECGWTGEIEEGKEGEELYCPACESSRLSSNETKEIIQEQNNQQPILFKWNNDLMIGKEIMSETFVMNEELFDIEKEKDLDILGLSFTTLNKNEDLTWFSCNRSRITQNPAPLSKAEARIILKKEINRSLDKLFGAKYQIQLVWNREFDWSIYYGETFSDLQEAVKFADDIRNSGDGARVKKVRVLDLLEDDRVVWDGYSFHY